MIFCNPSNANEDVNCSTALSMNCSELKSCLESKANEKPNDFWSSLKNENWATLKYAPIQLAARLNETEILEKLLNDCEYDINATDKNGWTALHSASAYNDLLNIVELLVDNGANKEAKTKYGNTPLHIAARYGILDNFQYLFRQNIYKPSIFVNFVSVSIHINYTTII